MRITIAIISALGALALLTGVVISSNFGSISVNQILFHLFSGMEIGRVQQTQDFINQLISIAIFPSMLFGLSAFLILRGVGLKANLVRLSAFGASVLLLGSIFFVDSKTGLTSYAESLGKESILDEYYVEPQFSEPEIKPNLIFVYLESIEAGFVDEEIYGENLIANLDEATSGPGWIDINTIEGSLPGTEWTIASLVSTQCGFPLVGTGVGGWNSSLEGNANFLENATCLGDVLSDAGYTNVFMGGAELSFAGKGNFLSSHGFDQSFGRSEWIANGHKESEMNWWGLRDEDLLQHAKLKLNLLERREAPFGMFLLTVDSHAPNGLPDERCESEKADSLERSIQCSTDSVAEFLNTIDIEENTSIVVLGDHPLMATTISETENGQSVNRVLFRIKPAANVNASGDREALPFDVFPTVLGSLGFDAFGKKAGLGVNILGSEKSILEEIGRGDLSSGLQVPSNKYWEFW